MQAVILAGGKGTRLKPFTTWLPKPLVPVCDMPILEIILKQLKNNHFTDVVLTVNHLADLIKAFFNDGEKIGLKIAYSMEDQPLGTAGPLKLINNLDENFLVMNGDLLTTLNYKALVDHHTTHKNDVTITVYQKEIHMNLGILEINGDEFINYIEKPTYYYPVSTGIYAFNKNVVKEIPENTRFDMPELIIQLKKKGKKIGCYSPDFLWLDIGRLDDYEQALDIFQKNKTLFLKNE